MVEEARVRIVVDDSAVSDLGEGGEAGLGGDNLPGDRRVAKFRRQMAERRVGRNGLPDWVKEDRAQLAGIRKKKEAGKASGADGPATQQATALLAAMARGDTQQVGNLAAGLVLEAIREQTAIGQTFTTMVVNAVKSPAAAAAIGVGVGLAAADTLSGPTAAGAARLSELVLQDIFGKVPGPAAAAIAAYRNEAENIRTGLSMGAAAKRSVAEGMSLASALAMTGQTLSADGARDIATGIFAENRAEAQIEQRIGLIQSENMAEGGYHVLREMTRAGGSEITRAMVEAMKEAIK